MDPLQFPPRAVPLIGEPCTVHPTWFISAPITCNCDAKTPLVVHLGNGLGPAVCPACLNVYGIVAMQGGGPKGLPPGIGVNVIGRAQQTVTDADVAKKLAETVN